MLLLVPCLMVALVTPVSARGATLSLDKSHSSIGVHGTANFTLSCTLGGRETSSGAIKESDVLETVHRLRILKSAGSKWTPVVAYDSDWDGPEMAEEIVGEAHHQTDVEGNVNVVEVLWDLAPNEVGGEYMCELLGDSVLGQAMVMRSSTVNIERDIDLTLFDLFELMKASQAKLDTALDDMKASNAKLDGVFGDMNVTNAKLDRVFDDMKVSNEKLDKVFNDMKISNEKLDGVFDDMKVSNRKLDKVSGDMNDLKEDVEKSLKWQEEFEEKKKMRWPFGFYALLQPESGCPEVNGWTTGYIRHHTESSGSSTRNGVSDPAHMKKPILEHKKGQYYMTQHFCSTSKRLSEHKPWPKGTYCVLKHGKNICPGGFASGSIQWDEEDTDNNSTCGGFIPWDDSSCSHPKLHYCCRDDGPQSVPIPLPTSKPFFLYRYKGTCQAVKGMMVTEEYMSFEPEENDNDSDGFGSNPVMTTFLPGLIQVALCYYQNMG